LWGVPVDIECEVPVDHPDEWLVEEWCDVDEEVWLLLFDPEWLVLLLPPFGPAKARSGSRSARTGRIFRAGSVQRTVVRPTGARCPTGLVSELLPAPEVMTGLDWK
jgi:hypothetical protein